MLWSDYVKQTRERAEQYLIDHWGTQLPASQRSDIKLKLETIGVIMLRLSNAGEVTGLRVEDDLSPEQQALINIHGIPWAYYCNLAGVSDSDNLTPQQIDCTLRKLAILFIGVPELIVELIANQKIR